MTTNAAQKTALATLLGVVAPIRAAVGAADWRDSMRDYNLVLAGVTATLIALWWAVRLASYTHQQYRAIFGAPPPPLGSRPLRLGDGEEDAGA